jgi:branched-subunit amino acid transport protein
VSWLAVGLVCVGCYVEKLLGMLVPAATLARWPLIDRLARRLPAALLAALVVTGALVRGHSLVIDARLAGLAVAVALLLVRAPLVVVVVGAALTAAGLRQLG